MEPEEPEQQSSFASRLLQTMEQHQQIVLAQNRINELEARLSGYETITPTKLNLNASEGTDIPYRAASSPDVGLFPPNPTPNPNSRSLKRRLNP